ncbi:MAG: hypothetical protein ABI843_05510 [Dokdonella sp.]
MLRIPLCMALAIVLLPSSAIADQTPLPNPILFVTQFPIRGDFAAIASVFANHRGSSDLVGRGGDLYIRYPDGSLRNLTQEAGFGSSTVFQGADSIAVRDPAVSWDGSKAIFSMVIGAPVEQYVRVASYFQLYEVSGLGEGQQAVIAKVPNQPVDRNNINPIYLSDDSILFASDMTRNGAPHLYPQLDEYEEQPTPTGLWRLRPSDAQPELLQYAVSGSFNPILDSFGRIVFTRWDHLQRDQQNDYGADNPYGIFNYSGEGPASEPTADRSEVYPEPRGSVNGSHLNGFSINQFFPWMVNQDGTSEETLNHIGRHELSGYFQRSFTNDPALIDFQATATHHDMENMLQIREDPTRPGRFVGIDAPEFYTQASGQIVAVDAAPDVNAAAMTVTYLNPSSDRGFYDGDPVPADFTGHFRNPLPLSDGRMIAAHTSESRSAQAAPYPFRLKMLSTGANGYLEAGENLTAEISKSVSYFDPDQLITYDGPFWELSPVEVRPRSVPPATGFTLKAPEQQAFALESVDPQAFRAYLRANGLAVIVVRNATARDGADQQQPYNLRVPGGIETVAPGQGMVYDISHMQFFQGDQIRGTGGTTDPAEGRRILAQTLHDGPAVIANASSPVDRVPIASDGSVALFVPSRRAMAWQSLTPGGDPVVRERYWITFQPGEIRECDGCHGINQQNQANQPAAENVALALRSLISRWRDHQIDLIFQSSMEPR